MLFRSMLYKTGVEYGDYTMNHVLGCAHGCKFPCYAYMMKKRFGEIASYEDWLEPSLVSNTLELLDTEIPRLRDKIHSVERCFTTDPFMCGYPEISEMSIAAIQKLNAAGIKCTQILFESLSAKFDKKAISLSIIHFLPANKWRGGWCRGTRRKIDKSTQIR